jgi:hypothetical protein
MEIKKTCSKSYRAPAPAQVLVNRQFLLAEIQEVQAAIALL